MKFRDYLKQRWYLFGIFFGAGVFAFLVSWSSGLILNKSFSYIIQGTSAAFIVFVLVDYIKLRSRIEYMKEYLVNNAVEEIRSNYPLDIKYASEIRKIVKEAEEYKRRMETDHGSELEFITKWVHDIKVPISAIELITEQTYSKDAQLIQMQLNYIDQNIQKILYHIKSKNFYDDYRIKETDTQTIIKGALKSYAVFFAYKSISLTLNYDNYKIYTDEKWSTYIISQFISNAVKYTEKGGEINIFTEETNDEVIIKVKNTGEGIEEENIRNIFRRGYSGYNARKEKSTGYGLYLSERLAEKMGHRLSAASEKGQYAEFALHFIKSNDKHYNNVSMPG